GLEMDVLPCSFYFKVDRALEDAKFVDVAEKIKHIRSVKSEFEVSLIKEAARILEAGFSSVPDFLEEGMKEVDLICRIESVMRSLGHVMCGQQATLPSFLASPSGGRGTSLIFLQGGQALPG
ncbi:MAG: aminopeptidase P family protein, partial [Methanothrix sp.]|nr:aminopeptidase P family protein [Methanothrix sp.]